MAQIAELNSSILDDEDDANYLYKKDVYVEGNGGSEEKKEEVKEENKPKIDENGYELPDFIEEEDEVIKID